MSYTHRRIANELSRLVPGLGREQLDALYGRLPVMLHTANAEGRLTSVSDFWLSNLGYSRSEVLGRPATDFLSETSRHHAENVCLPAFRQFGAVSDEELSFLHKDGSPVVVLLSAIADLDADGEIVRSVAISIDQNDRRAVERALSDSESSIQTIYEAANDPILILSIDADVILSGNPRARKLLGYTAEELAGLSVETTHPSEMHKIVEVRETVDATGVARARDIVCRTKDGRGVPADVSFSRITMKDRDLIMAVIRDMSEVHAAREQMRCYQQKLRSLTRELSVAEEQERRRIATDLHDTVAQSLVLASLKLSEVRSSANSQPPDGLDDLQEIVDRAIKETRTVLYDISPPVLHDVGLEAAIRWKLDRFSAEHGIGVKFNDDQQHKPIPESLKTFLFKAVQELLKNIVKHANASTVTVNLNSADGVLRVTVRDDGIGFDVSDPNPCDDVHSGFGLFNIRDRLDYYGGRTEIISAPGSGTIVDLYAPLAGDRSIVDGLARE